MTHTNFQIFSTISLAIMVEIYTMNSLIKKNVIMSKALFGVAQLKHKKKYIVIKESSRSRKSCFL